MTPICVSKLTIIGSDNGLSPDRRQAIIWTNAGILLFGPLGTNFSEILIEILTFSFEKMRLKVSSGNWQPFCFGLNVLIGPTGARFGAIGIKTQTFHFREEKNTAIVSCLNNLNKWSSLSVSEYMAMIYGAWKASNVVYPTWLLGWHALFGIAGVWFMILWIYLQWNGCLCNSTVIGECIGIMTVTTHRSQLHCRILLSQSLWGQLTQHLPSVRFQFG